MAINIKTTDVSYGFSNRLKFLSDNDLVEVVIEPCSCKILVFTSFLPALSIYYRLTRL